MAHLLGVDTGGTFTDAVVWCDETERVLGSAKAPTSHHDLAVGIGAAMDAAMTAADRYSKKDPRTMELPVHIVKSGNESDDFLALFA